MALTPRRIVRFDWGFRQDVGHGQTSHYDIACGIAQANAVELGGKNRFWRNPKTIYSGAIIMFGKMSYIKC
jgi:hypothetical protein